jgi:hypothetical protein
MAVAMPTNSHSTDTNLASSGPSTTSPTSCEPVKVRWNRLLACNKRRRETTAGIMAVSAGAKN